MTIAVLALQGAFAEHEKMIRSLGADCIELRQADDLKKHYDGLILPAARVLFRESSFVSLACLTQ